MVLKNFSQSELLQLQGEPLASLNRPPSQPFSVACTATSSPHPPLFPTFTSHTIAYQDYEGNELHIDITAVFNALLFPHCKNEIHSPYIHHNLTAWCIAGKPEPAHAANHVVTRAISELRYSEGIQASKRPWEHYWLWSPQLILRARERERGGPLQARRGTGSPHLSTPP